MNARGDDPTPLAQPLARVRAELGLPEPDAVDRLRAAWADVVGGDLAAHTRIRTLRDGILTIAVDAPAWATPLRYQRADIATRAETATGGPVNEVHIVVDAPS